VSVLIGLNTQVQNWTSVGSSFTGSGISENVCFTLSCFYIKSAFERT